MDTKLSWYDMDTDLSRCEMDEAFPLISELLATKFYSIFHSPKNSDDNGYKKVQRLSTGNRVFGKKLKTVSFNGRQVKVLDIQDLFTSKLKLHDYVPEIVIQEENLETFEFTNVDFVGDTNKTPMLHLECARGDLAMVRLLIDNGAKVNRHQENGNTALMEAVFLHTDHHLEIARLLLAAGADVNIQNKAGYSAFTVAVSTGNVIALKLMKDWKGVSVNTEVKTNNGMTALIIAATRNDRDMIKYLVEQCDANIVAATNNGKWTAYNLVTVLYTTAFSIMKYLAEKLVEKSLVKTYIRRRIYVLKRNTMDTELMLTEMISFSPLFLLESSLMPSDLRRTAMRVLMDLEADACQDDHNQQCNVVLHRMLPWFLLLTVNQCHIRSIQPETQRAIVLEFFALEADEFLLKCVKLYQEDDIMMFNFIRVIGFLCSEDEGIKLVETHGEEFQRCSEVTNFEGRFCGRMQPPVHQRFSAPCVDLIRCATADNKNARAKNIDVVKNCIGRCVADKNMIELIEEEEAEKRKREKKRERKRRRQQQKRAKEKTGAEFFESSDESDNDVGNDADYSAFSTPTKTNETDSKFSFYTPENKTKEDVDYGIFSTPDDKNKDQVRPECNEGADEVQTDAGTVAADAADIQTGPYWGFITTVTNTTTENDAEFATVTKKSAAKKPKPVYNSTWGQSAKSQATIVKAPVRNHNYYRQQSGNAGPVKRVVPAGMSRKQFQRQIIKNKKKVDDTHRHQAINYKSVCSADENTQEEPSGTYVPAPIEGLFDESAHVKVNKFTPKKSTETYEDFINRLKETPVKNEEVELENAKAFMKARGVGGTVTRPARAGDYGLDTLEFPIFPLEIASPNAGVHLDGLWKLPVSDHKKKQTTLKNRSKEFERSHQDLTTVIAWDEDTPADEVVTSINPPKTESQVGQEQTRDDHARQQQQLPTNVAASNAVDTQQPAWEDMPEWIAKAIESRVQEAMRQFLEETKKASDNACLNAAATHSPSNAETNHLESEHGQSVDEHTDASEDCEPSTTKEKLVESIVIAPIHIENVWAPSVMANEGMTSEVEQDRTLTDAECFENNTDTDLEWAPFGTLTVRREPALRGTRSLLVQNERDMASSAEANRDLTSKTTNSSTVVEQCGNKPSTIGKTTGYPTVRKYHSNIEIPQVDGIGTLGNGLYPESLSQPNTVKTDPLSRNSDAGDIALDADKEKHRMFRQVQFGNLTNKSFSAILGPNQMLNGNLRKNKPREQGTKTNQLEFDVRKVVHSSLHVPNLVQQVYRAEEVGRCKADSPKFIIHLSGSESSDSDTDSEDISSRPTAELVEVEKHLASSAEEVNSTCSSYGMPAERTQQREQANLCCLQSFNTVNNLTKTVESIERLQTAIADDYATLSTLSPQVDKSDHEHGVNVGMDSAFITSKLPTEDLRRNLDNSESKITKAPKVFDIQTILSQAQQAASEGHYFPSMPTGSVFAQDLEVLLSTDTSWKRSQSDHEALGGQGTASDLEARLIASASCSVEQNCSQPTTEYPKAKPNQMTWEQISKAKLRAESDGNLEWNVLIPVSYESGHGTASSGSSGTSQNEDVVTEDNQKILRTFDVKSSIIDYNNIDSQTSQENTSLSAAANPAEESSPKHQLDGSSLATRQSQGVSTPVSQNLPISQRTSVESTQTNPNRTSPGLCPSPRKQNEEFLGFGQSPSLRGGFGAPCPWIPRSLVWNNKLSALFNIDENRKLRFGSMFTSNDTSSLIWSHRNGVKAMVGISYDGHEVALKQILKVNYRGLESWLTKVRRLQMDNRFLARYFNCIEDIHFGYLAMELCEYNLTQYMMLLSNAGRLKTEALSICYQILSGLQALHDVAMLHMNLKPTNVMVDAEGRVKLADYGLFYGSPKAHNQSMRSILNVCWCPTEVLNPKWQGFPYTPASDVQVAGMLIHYVLTGGLHPFGDDAMHCQVNIKLGNLRFGAGLGFLGQHLLSWMLPPDMHKRKFVSECLLHPLFWHENKRFAFILIVAEQSDVKEKKKNAVTREIDSYASWIGCTDWKQAVAATAAEGLLDGEVYSNSVCDLLRCIGDTARRLRKMPVDYQSNLVRGNPRFYFDKLYPKLFLPIYDIVQKTNWKNRQSLSTFFVRQRM